MKILSLPFGPLSSNMYIICLDKGFIFVDPSVSPKRVSSFVKDFDVSKLLAVLITHGHFDHVYFVEEWCQLAPDIPFFMSSEDERLLADPCFNCSFMAGAGKKYDVKTTSLDKLGDFAGQIGVALSYISTPGHTAGSVCYRLKDKADQNDYLFSGDLLFAGSIGRTDFPSGNTGEMMNSLDLVKKLPEGIVVLPGHGPETTVSVEVSSNPYFI